MSSNCLSHFKRYIGLKWDRINAGIGTVGVSVADFILSIKCIIF